MEKTIERLRTIVDSGNLSAEDKLFIADLSVKHGLAFDPKKGCKDCFIDQAVLLHKELTKGQPKPSSKARLRDDIDVIIDGHRINNATLTDELVEKYRGKGLPEHWFV